MKIHRFIIPCGQLEEGQNLSVDDPRVVWQVTRVLRLKKNDVIAICNGEHQEGKAHIQSLDKEKIEVLIKSTEVLQNNLKETTLYCSLIKKDNFELVVQKATEIGVSEIVPIVTHRVVKLGLRYDRLQNIALEASEQSGRGSIPKLHQPIPYEEAIQSAKEINRQNILFDGSGEELDIGQLSSDKTGVFIGPEGGFDDEEVDLARAEGLVIASLGSLILRAETAAIVVSYIMTR